MTPLSLPTTFPIKEGEFQIKSKLKRTTINSIAAAEPYKIGNYAQLNDLVAKLAHANRSYVLFFRGQKQEHRLGNRFPTIYPTLFRKHISQGISLDELFQQLENEQEMLRIRNHFRKPRFAGASSVMSSFQLRCALLQHYEICDTPMIDVSQSLHVATSFALGGNEKGSDKSGIIYVLALPWPSKNYHNNKEEDLYLVRLAGITPPQAKRPYRQEAFAVMSNDLATTQIQNLDLQRLDFANRLVCKFEINKSKEFWNNIAQPLPKSFLSPKQDIFYQFMKKDIDSLTTVNWSFKK